MPTLAVTTRAETAERIAAPLAERGIDVRHLPTTGRAIPLDGSALPNTIGDAHGAIEDERRRNEHDGFAPEPDTEFDVGLVYPSRLTEGGAIDALYGFPWVNDREAVLTSRNKAGVLATLGEEGIPVPETVLCSDPVGQGALEGVFERFDPPVVVKPNSATRGIGVTKASDRDSFLGVCDYLDLIHEFPATGDKSFLVQEYLADARDYRLMVIDGECVGAVERRGAGWKHNVHRGAEAVGLSPPDDLARLAERVARVLDVPYLGVDLLATEGRTVVTETNARPTVDDASKYQEGFYDAFAALIRATAE
jgi:ribosomal protein S6--L-glutamate ligase